MKILLTAFEPFDSTAWNASLEGCRQFLAQVGSHCDLRFAVLPVAYGPDVTAVEAALDDWPAEVILHTGQAGGSPAVRVERLAVNVRYALDDPGVDPDAQHPIDPDGPMAMAATVPIGRIVSAIRGSGVPAVVSNHAGIYLCNHALYHSLRRAERSQRTHQVGFLHVPRLPQQVVAGEPSMPVEAVARAVHAALTCLRDNQ